MAVARLQLANPQPLVKLEHHHYQVQFMEARRLRRCENGHDWRYEFDGKPRNLACPICAAKSARAFRYFLLRAGRRGGKALDLRTSIPTPDGWTTMEALRVGDVIFDDLGNPTRVTHTSPVYTGHECFRVEFSDGQSLIADGDHQWTTWTKRSRKRAKFGSSVVTTREIAATLKTPSGESNHAIPPAVWLFRESRALPVGPYTLGAWLGDGSSASAEICCTDTEILDHIREEGYAIGTARRAKNRAPMYLLGGAPRSRNVASGQMQSNASLNSTLRGLGLLRNKHIPEDYFLGSFDQRLALLQGLMDTDGQVNRDGSCEFDSTNPALAHGVWRLATELGMIARLYASTAKLYGREIGPKWRVTFRAIFPVARLTRKVARIEAGKGKPQYRFITNVVPVPTRPVKCIQVDSPSSLYLAGEACIPTHNTRIGALALIDELSVPGILAWGAAPSFPMLEDFLLPAFFKQIPQVWLDHPLTKWSESERTLTLPNTSVAQFRSLEDPDRGRGPGLDVLWMDEVNLLSENHWETIMPALGDRAGIAIFTSTPRGPDWVHEKFFERAEQGWKGYWACHYSSLDNPGMPKESVELARLEMTDLMFRQEYMADIVTFTGSIYGEILDRALIDGTDEEMRYYFPEWRGTVDSIDPSRETITGLDPGTDHPFAGVHTVKSPRGMVVVGEYLERNKVYQQHAQGIHLLRGPRQGRIAIDRSQAQAQLELSQHGLFTAAAENDVIAGINRVSAWILANLRTADHPMPSGGLIIPKRFAPRLVKQMRAYRWGDTENKDGSLKRELVHKKDDDLPDSLRYQMMLWPDLPKADPALARPGLRSLVGMPDHMRLEIERMRRVEALEKRMAQGEERAILLHEDVRMGGDEEMLLPGDGGLEMFYQ